MIATIALVSGLRSRLCVNNNDLPAASGLVWSVRPPDIQFLFSFIEITKC